MIAYMIGGEAVSLSKSQLKQLFDSDPDAIVVMKDEKIFYKNNAAKNSVPAIDGKVTLNDLRYFCSILTPPCSTYAFVNGKFFSISYTVVDDISVFTLRPDNRGSVSSFRNLMSSVSQPMAGKLTLIRQASDHIIDAMPESELSQLEAYFSSLQHSYYSTLNLLENLSILSDSRIQGKASFIEFDIVSLLENVIDGVRSVNEADDPELVYSGPAKGIFRDTIAALRKDKMEQYVVTAATPAFFAADGQPVHAFFTAQRQGAVRGRTVTLEREADLLLADRDFDFTDVTANGAAVATRKIRLNGGLVGTLVRLGVGTWKLGWQAVRRKDAAPSAADLPVVPEKRPLTAVPKPRLYIEPEKLVVTNVGRTLACGVKLLRKGVYSSSIPLVIRLQENLPITCTEADETKLRLTAGPSRRQFYVRTLETYAGFELEGARQVKLRFSHNYDDTTQGVARNPYKTGDNAGLPTEYFGGISVDYSVGGRYVKRVSMDASFYHPDCRLKGAKWGKHGMADERLDLGAWIEQPSPKTFSLDLVRFAPAGWDGRAWLSLGTCRFLAGHHLELEILSFNDAAAKDFVVPVVTKNPRVMPVPLKSAPLRKKPRSLTALDAAEWKGWAKIDSFWMLGSGRPKAQTKAFLAHDYEYLYVGIEADEPLTPSHAGKEAWSNDHAELLVERSDGRIYQVIAAPDSETVLLLDRKRAEPKGVVVKDAVESGKGWKLFLAVPLDDLKPNMQLTPVTLKLELARIRKAGDERSAWTPIETGFFERKSYGTVILDYSWTKGGE